MRATALLTFRHAVKPKRDILRHSQMGKEGVLLKHHADVSPLRGHVMIRIRYQTSLKAHFPIVQPLEACNDPQQCGLSTATRAQYGQHFARHEAETHIVHNEQVPKAFRRTSALD